MSRDGLFSFLARASATKSLARYTPGKRYELIVFVRETSEEAAKTVFRKVVEGAGWDFPEIQEIAQIDGAMKWEKVRQINLDQAIQAAIRNGSAIVVFQNP